MIGNGLSSPDMLLFESRICDVFLQSINFSGYVQINGDFSSSNNNVGTSPWDSPTGKNPRGLCLRPKVDGYPAILRGL